MYVVSAEHDKVKDWRVTPLALIDGPFEYDAVFYNRLIDRAIEFTPMFPRSSEAKKTKKSNQISEKQLIFSFDK